MGRTVSVWSLGTMTRRVAEQEINNFSGGLHSTAAITELNTNEAYDLSNIVIGPNGNYIRSKNGNSLFNATAMNSGANVQSLSYYKLVSGTEFLVSICGDKIFKSDNLDGVMDDITGSLTITAGQNNIWTFLTFNNVHIGFGGSETNPDNPIQWTGTGNAALLSGTPPLAYGAVQCNNRVFAFRTAVSPSIIQWCTLGNPQDWTGSGSGSQTISTSDNDSVTALAVMDNNVILVFKENSVHKLIVSNLVSGSFPSFLLFRNTGCAGKNAVVVSDGLCYYVTPDGKMRITDGETIIDEKDLPQLAYIDDTWSEINSSRYRYIQGYKVEGSDYEHIVWIVTSESSGLTNDLAIRWDIKNRCWLKDDSGFKMNVISSTQLGTIYTGNYSGFIYKQDDNTVTTEASENGTNVNSFWKTGWFKYISFDVFKSIYDCYISYVTQNFGDLVFLWGYDFNEESRNQVISQLSGSALYNQAIYDVGLYGGQTDKIAHIIPSGNGRVFQFVVRNMNYKMKINSINLIGKKMDKN